MCSLNLYAMGSNSSELCVTRALTNPGGIIGTASLLRIKLLF